MESRSVEAWWIVLRKQRDMWLITNKQEDVTVEGDGCIPRSLKGKGR
jgi:hypothetical protein